MNVAVVRNRKNPGVINRFGQPSPETYGRRSVQGVLDSLRSGGHTAKVFEGDMNLLAELARFMPPDPSTLRPSGLVFNMSYGIQGEGRYAHVPALLEMAGVPYTGSGPRAHAACLDKVVTKLVIREAGIPTPGFCVLGAPDQVGRADGLRFPLVVKPRYESTSCGLALVHDRSELAAAVQAIVTAYRQDALVEEYVEGREVAAALLGNGPPEVLPLVEIDFGPRAVRMMTKPDKFHRTDDEPGKLCPAPLAPDVAARVREIAVGVFTSCQCRDYARVDLRIDAAGTPYVLEINSMASLGAGGAYVLAAREAGYDFEALVNRIADVAHERCLGGPAPREGSGAAVPIRHPVQ